MAAMRSFDAAADSFSPEPAPRAVPALTGIGFREIRRSITIHLVLFTRIAIAWMSWALTRKRGDWQSAVSEGVVRAFEILGPTFVKIGQLIASSPGVFPAPLAQACQRCLDEVPPFPVEQVHEILVADLGRPTSELFAEFDETPLSAASIAQVHGCVLLDGRQAVVKVQRPDIRDRMTVDLRIAYRLALILERCSDVFRIANATGLVRDLHAVTFEELDAEREAQRQSRFRAALGALGGNKWVTAPEVYQDYCGPRVICMERMYGVALDDFEAVRDREVDGELLIRRLVKAWLEGVAVHGAFHGDVHAGNLLLLDDGRIAFLDFGIMGELTEQWRSLVRDLFVTTALDGDFSRLITQLRELGVLNAVTGTDAMAGAQLQLLFMPMLASGIGQISLGQLFKTVVQMARQHQGASPQELILVGKQLAYFERYAKELAPNWVLAQDLFLISDIFPEAVARRVAELKLTLPAD